MQYTDTQGITWNLEAGDCTHLIPEFTPSSQDGLHEVAWDQDGPTVMVYHVVDLVVTHSRYNG